MPVDASGIPIFWFGNTTFAQMQDGTLIDQVITYADGMPILEILGLVFGLLAVWFLIKENIYTWPSGISYVIISFVIFWQQRLYGDFLLHIFFLVLNIYGWYFWIKGKPQDENDLPVTTLTAKQLLYTAVASAVGVVAFGYFLWSLPIIIEGLPEASLPFWDATTSVLSVTGMWLTAKKKIENWYYWLIVDILATGIYAYKGVYFYAVLYFIYIGMAIAGYLSWKRSMKLTTAST